MNCQLESATVDDRPTGAPYGAAIATASLSIGGLFLGTGEFVSMSLLPAMADATNVSIPIAGSYVSSYALGVVLGAPLIAALGARWSRKTLLIALLALFVLGYSLSAIAWDHYSLLAARFIAGLPHGAYYGIAGLVAAAMAPPNRRAQAIGYVMLGLAAANIAGVPAATWLGQEFGWRAAFSAITVGGVFTLTMVSLCVPKFAPDTSLRARDELSALLRLRVWLTFAVAAIGFGGLFAVYSYITPTLTEVAGLPLSAVPMTLVVFGVGMMAGNTAGSWLADRALIPAIYGMVVWNVVTLCLFSLMVDTPTGAVASLFLVGAGFGLVPSLQALLMQIAGKAQTLAAALVHSAFNVANAIGATLGGAAIARGWGYDSTGWVGGALAAAGLVFLFASNSGWVKRRDMLSE